MEHDMKRQKHVKNELPLLLYGELDTAATKAVQQHLAGCKSCRLYSEELQKLHHAMTEARPPVFNDAALLKERRGLLRTIRGEQPQVAAVSRWRELLGFAEGPAWRPALVMGAVAIIAFAAGVLLFSSSRSLLPGLRQAAYDPYGDPMSFGPLSSGLMSQEAQITNLRILLQDQPSGEIEFEFEAIVPVHIKGNMHDLDVQAILAKALVSSQNPGIRLRAANAIADRPQEEGFVNGTRLLIKESLISAVLYDNNRGVRLEAMKALRDFLPDSAATSAILKVLTTETNVAMKIAAINSLDLAKFTEAGSRENLLTTLRERSLVDDNNYIRIRAKAALQEVQQ